jgi:hypothetical protein
MPEFTREQLLATWAKYGTGEPLSERQIEAMLSILNEPVARGELPITLCGSRPDPRYSYASLNPMLAVPLIEAV